MQKAKTDTQNLTMIHSILQKPLCLLLIFLATFAVSAQNRQNPVLQGVADAGVIRWAGKYYLGGVGTNGDLYISSDLLNWNEKIHVFDLDNEWTQGTGAKNNMIHSNDLSYSNGLFHLLFSANYWGDDRHIVHCVHAVSPTIEGPFREPRTDQWFENRIDPQVFRDEDGRLYFYVVKFTDGNVIWAREMNQDFSFAGEPVEQFSSQKGTWETMNERVAEGPFVIKYRGRYYMMYNANHTDPSYGSYQLGVCEADNPLHFNTGGKYSHPVVRANTDSYKITGDEHLLTPGQPNIVRGPNGWEYWLSYMANNHSGRHQFIDQIFFVNNRLTVDGITGARTPGFHPCPTQPQWEGQNTESLVLGENFLLELTFSSQQKKQGINLGGRKILLPDDMVGVPHEWRIEKNSGHLSVWIDKILLLNHAKVGSTEGKKVKWIGNLQNHDIQYVQYTEGWDEWGTFFSGWKGLCADDHGLQLPQTDILKGKGAKDFSFSAMMQNENMEAGLYGIQAVADSENHIRASIDAQKRMLVVETVLNGIGKRLEYDLCTLEEEYPDIKYSDFQEQQYCFSCLTEISQLQIPTGKTDKLQLCWWDGNTWHQLTPSVSPSEKRKEWECANFPAIKTTAIRATNSDPTEYGRQIYRIYSKHNFSANYQIRMDKRGKELHLFIDNREMAVLPIEEDLVWRPGLFSDGKAPVHVCNTLWYHIR